MDQDLEKLINELFNEVNDRDPFMVNIIKTAFVSALEESGLTSIRAVAKLGLKMILEQGAEHDTAHATNIN